MAGVISSCTCPVPRRHPGNSMCATCGRYIFSPVKLEKPQPIRFYNDHGPYCTCFNCVMRRRNGHSPE